MRWVVSLLLAISTGSALGQDSWDRFRGPGTDSWDRFRGPNGTGLAAGDDWYPVDIGPGRHEAWSHPFPAGMSSPTLGAKHLYLTGVEEEKLFTYAVDRATGATVWKREAPRPRRTKFHEKNHPAAASAAVDADTVVVFFDEYGMLAYDHEGNERWRMSRPQAISGHCTPVVWRSEEGAPQVVLPGSFLLDAYDLEDGERVWWVEGLPSEMKSVPVILGDVLWIHGYGSPLNDKGNQVELAPWAEMLAEHDADGDGGISAAELPDPAVARYYQWLDLSGNGTLDADEWTMARALFASVNSALAVRLGGTGDLTEQVIWRQYRNIPQLPSPLIVDGAYYLVSDSGGLLTTLSPETGERTGRIRLEGATDNYFTSPVAGGGHVYLLSESGVLSVLAVGPTLEAVHHAEFEQLCYATPTLADGRIYLRTMERLYCFHTE